MRLKFEITGASTEKENDKVVFEVSLKKDGKNIDVTLTEGGVFTVIKQELAFADQSKAVAKTFEDIFLGALADLLVNSIGGV